jgi:elongator complex protein 3
MIRDISAPDIVVGNKKTNLRQMVEQRLDASGREIQEIRYREIALDTVGVDELALQTTAYDTSCAQELFIEWVSGEDRIAGFLRLSLPKAEVLSELVESLPIAAGQAMIREVHVYGQVARLSSVSAGAQHLGLGRQLIDYACEIARDSGYESINVISSIGTREYYRRLGFTDGELYQSKLL